MIQNVHGFVRFSIDVWEAVNCWRFLVVTMQRNIIIIKKIYTASIKYT